MPSGGITITPGKILADNEEISDTKLNSGFRPVGRVDEGAITSRELASSVNNIISAFRGKNLFCNGNFQLWDYITGGFGSVTGVQGGGTHPHDYWSANRWVTANDANRTASSELFGAGQTEVPDFPREFLRWLQAAPVALDPSYFGQRIENVYSLANRTLTMSVWVRPDADVTVQPVARQFFGIAMSDDVLIEGDEVALPASVWTQVTATFEIPTVAGKTIVADPSFSFTEFRINVPQDIAFQLDFAHAQLEAGNAATSFEQKMIHEEFVYAMRYYEVLGMMLSTDVTIVKPFVRATFPKRGGVGPTLVAASGTGATIASGALDQLFVFQDTDHSAVVSGAITFDGELYAE